MQKKIIALAVAGLVLALPSRSNVVIYGVADAGYVYGSDSFVTNGKSTSKMTSGNGQSGSCLGFRAARKICTGLSANFKYEQALNIDVGGETVAGGGRWGNCRPVRENLGFVRNGSS